MKIKYSLSKYIFGISILFLLLVIGGCKRNPFVVSTPEPNYPVIDDFPSFSPNGDIIAYHHYHMTYIDTSGGYYYITDSTGIWFINADGSDATMFLQGADIPDWSPDGEWIAFGAGAHIYKIKTKGTDLTQLTFGRRTFFPDWSPDGKKIAYDQSTGEYPGIWIMDYDGINDHRVIGGYSPDWSPDGAKMAYVAYDGIYIADTNGTNIIQIHHGGKQPAWSPDGLRIAFSLQAVGEVPQIWVMNVDGGNPRQLTTKGGFTPAWSPDGKKIVYCQFDAEVYNPRENGTLWIMDADGSNKRQLTLGPDTSKE